MFSVLVQQMKSGPMIWDVEVGSEMGVKEPGVQTQNPRDRQCRWEEGDMYSSNHKIILPPTYHNIGREQLGLNNESTWTLNECIIHSSKNHFFIF